MDEELVTAASFGDQTQAFVVRNALQEAGIPAFLVGEWMSQALFTVGGATGGVQVQVPRSRLPEALRVIDAHAAEHSAPVDWSQVDVGSREPDELPQEVADTPVGPLPAAGESIAGEAPDDLTLREQRADRIVVGVLIGLFFWPILLLAVWRLAQIANSTERLRPEYRRKANLGALLILVPIVAFVLLCCLSPLAQFIGLRRGE